MKTFKYYKDSSHSWLEVTRNLLKKLKIDNQISPWSHQKGNKVYLECDNDANLFLDVLYEVYKYNKDKINIVEINHFDISPIREYDIYKS